MRNCNQLNSSRGSPGERDLGNPTPDCFGLLPLCLVESEPGGSKVPAGRLGLRCRTRVTYRQGKRLRSFLRFPSFPGTAAFRGVCIHSENTAVPIKRSGCWGKPMRDVQSSHLSQRAGRHPPP